MTADARYVQLRRGLTRLTSRQLQRILACPDAAMVFDTWNYDEATRRF